MARKTLALGNLIFVMGKDIIHAAGMQIELLAEVFDGHGAALYMPAGETTPPRTIPGHFASLFCRFPQRKIFGIMAVGIYAFAYSCQHVFKLITGEFAVARETFNVVVDIAIDFIGNTLRQQTRNDGYHLWNMLGGAREDMSG